MGDIARDRKRVDLVPAEAQRARAEIEINNALGGRKGTAGDYGKNEAYLYERKRPEVLAFAKSPEDERGSRQCQGKNGTFQLFEQQQPGCRLLQINSEDERDRKLREK